MLETVPASAGGTAKQDKDTVAAARRFLTALAAQTGLRLTKQDAALAALPPALEFLAALPTLKPSARAAATLLSRLAGRLGAPAGSRLLLAWLLLKGRKIELETFGLDYSLKRACGLETAFEGQPCCPAPAGPAGMGSHGEHDGGQRCGRTGLCDSRLLHVHAGA